MVSDVDPQPGAVRLRNRLDPGREIVEVGGEDRRAVQTDGAEEVRVLQPQAKRPAGPSGEPADGGTASVLRAGSGFLCVPGCIVGAPRLTCGPLPFPREDDE